MHAMQVITTKDGTYVLMMRMPTMHIRTPTNVMQGHTLDTHVMCSTSHTIVNPAISAGLFKGTVQQKLTGVESDINRKVFLLH